MGRPGLISTQGLPTTCSPSALTLTWNSQVPLVTCHRPLGVLSLTQPAPRCCPTVPLFLWVSASPQGGHSQSRRHYSPSRREGARVRSWAPASCGMGCASVFSQLTPPSPPGGPLCPFLAPRGFPTGWLRDNPSLLMDVPPENC